MTSGSGPDFVIPSFFIRHSSFAVNIPEHRKAIDRLDAQIVRVLNERMVHFPYYWDDDGACQYGYEAPVVETFRSETGAPILPVFVRP